MAGCAGESCSLLVQISPVACSAERLEHKLQIYFQSQKRSGGGECDLVAEGPNPGIYRVQFRSEEVKQRVKAIKEHCLEIGDTTLKICILPDCKKTAEKSLADKWTSQIFLRVSATLNTELFTKEERDQMLALFPTLKFERSSNELGVQQVAGDYSDVEKLHRHLERLLTSSQRSSSRQSSNPKSQNTLNEKSMEEKEEGSGNDLEEVFDMEVPSGVFDYFSYICKENVKALEQTFNVKLTSKEKGSGLTSIQLASVGRPSFIKEAQQTFVRDFQKEAAGLKQEIIPFPSSLQSSKALEKLNSKFKRILVKRDGNTLILRGSAIEISTAKELMEEIKAENLLEKPDVSYLKNSVEVDGDILEFLRPMLVKEIDYINKKYSTVMEMKSCPGSLKIYVLFTSKKSKHLDSQACEMFRHVYQKASIKTVKTCIPLMKLSGDQQRKLIEFFDQLHRGNPRVSLKKIGNELSVIGLGQDVSSAVKDIMNFLDISVPAGPPVQMGSIEATSGASLEENRNCKHPSVPSVEPSNAANTMRVKEEEEEKKEEEEECAICIDKICQKEVLPKCSHAFCKGCIEHAMKYKPVCPVCNMNYGKMEGNQPPGTMTYSKSSQSVPGYERSGSITIHYHIPDGIQSINHPNPGKRFTGAHRIAYLPDNREGNEILQLLRKAFDQKLIFTVGESRTSGLKDVVTWNDIHHKTNVYGGPERYGYPDPHYLKRVREELKAKGIE